MPEAYDIEQLGLSDTSEIRELLKKCTDIEPRWYRDGEFLMREGEESSDLFIILEGACVVERPGPSPEAPPVVLATLMASPDNLAILGEMAYFGTQRRSASVRCVGSTHTLCLHPHNIEVIVEGFPSLLKLIFRQFTQRLLESNQALKNLQAKFSLAAERRLANPGDVLFRAGELADTLYQVVLGEIRLERPGRIDLVGPEDLTEGFLELGPFLRGQPHGCTAVVESAAFLIGVAAKHRDAVVRSYPQLVVDCLEHSRECPEI